MSNSASGKLKMPSVDLDEYRKETAEKIDAVTTSLNLERRHLDFLRKNNLNLSRLVRDFLNSLIKGETENGKNQK